MPEPWVITTVLCLIGACLLVMTITAVMVAGDLRRTLRGINTLLPRLETVAKDARQVLTGARRVVAGADRASRQVEHVVQRVCETAEETVERVMGLKAQAETFVRKWFGNGARSEPRLRYRR